MFKRKPNKLLGMALALMMSSMFSSTALADDLSYSDTDTIVVIKPAKLDFGIVTANNTYTGSDYFVISRQGGGNNNIFADNSTVTLKSVASDNPDITATIDPAINTMAIPSGWKDSGTISSSAKAIITLKPIDATPGKKSAKITFNATGTDRNGASKNVSIDVTYSWEIDGSTPSGQDTTAPLVTVSLPAVDGTNGWYKTSPVALNITATDSSNVAEILVNGSAIPIKTGENTGTATAEYSLSSQGSTILTITAKDGKGNTGAAVGSVNTPVTINLDSVAPVITAGSPTGTPGNNGWWRSNVTVPFTATDATSGLEGGSPRTLTNQVSVGEGENIIVTSESVTDLAGNTASGIQAGPFKVDYTAPVITAGSPTGTPGNNGWWRSNVTVPFTAADATSGLEGGSSRTLTDQVSVGEGENIIVTSESVTDLAGNTASGIQAGLFKVDYTAPVITINAPAEGAKYMLGSSVLADWSASDTLSGVAASSGTAAVGEAIDTGSVGTKTFTVQAEDAAGNQTTSNRTYNVTYDFSGFFQPVEMGSGIYNRVKAGSSIPIKFTLGGYQGLSVLAAGYPKVINYKSPTSNSIVEDISPEMTVSAGGSNLTFDGLQYVYIWKTSKDWAGNTKQLQFQFIDGQTYTAQFQFTK